jgi:hypothetical protein
MFSYYQKPKMNVQEMIAAEKLLSKQERRERYRCRSKYTTLDKITPWFVDLVAFQKIQQNPPIQTLRDANLQINRKISHFTGNSKSVLSIH